VKTELSVAGGDMGGRWGKRAAQHPLLQAKITKGPRQGYKKSLTRRRKYSHLQIPRSRKRFAIVVPKGVRC